MVRHTSCKTGGYATEAVLRPVITHWRFGLALNIRSLPASRTALLVPRTHNQEIFAAGATSLRVDLAKESIGVFLKCVTPGRKMRHSAYFLVNTTFIIIRTFSYVLCSVGLFDVADVSRLHAMLRY